MLAETKAVQIHGFGRPDTTSSTSVYTTPEFWERLWRMSGINFLLFSILAYIIYPHSQAGASPDALVAFYAGGHVRILIAAVFSGMAILNLLWFVSALRTTLADAGQDGWGAAATTASAVLGGFFLLLLTIPADLTYSIAGSGNSALLAGLNELAWAGFVMTSFPRAMLIMSGSFGLWRAKMISNAMFAAGVAAIVLVLLGGTTWASSGFWAPFGVYSRFVSPLIGFVWVAVVSRVLLTRPPVARAW